MKVKGTSALGSAVLAAVLACASPARAQQEECTGPYTDCVTTAELYHLACLIAYCPFPDWLNPGCSVECQAMYQMDMLECGFEFAMCLERQNQTPAPNPTPGPGSQTCFLTCGDGSIASGGCLNTETAFCSCDGRSRGGSVDAYFDCCKPGGPCPP